MGKSACSWKAPFRLKESTCSEQAAGPFNQPKFIGIYLALSTQAPSCEAGSCMGPKRNASFWPEWTEAGLAALGNNGN